jgi:hypothetical protein
MLDFPPLSPTRAKSPAQSGGKRAGQLKFSSYNRRDRSFLHPHGR